MLLHRLVDRRDRVGLVLAQRPLVLRAVQAVAEGAHQAVDCAVGTCQGTPNLTHIERAAHVRVVITENHLGQVKLAQYS